MGAPVGNCNAAKNKAACRAKKGTRKKMYLLADSAKPIKRITFGSGRSMIIRNKRSPRYGLSYQRHLNDIYRG